MDNVLLKLKNVLNGLTDEELKNYDLWIDHVEIIAVDDNSVVLITDASNVKVGDLEW